MECADGSLDHDISLIIRNLSSVQCEISLKAPSGNYLALCHGEYNFLNEAIKFFAKTDQQALKWSSMKIFYHTSNTNPIVKALADQ